eukprot:scaffold13468_cov94-Isochrysis_galbana.AAC.2
MTLCARSSAEPIQKVSGRLSPALAAKRGSVGMGIVSSGWPSPVHCPGPCPAAESLQPTGAAPSPAAPSTPLGACRASSGWAVGAAGLAGAETGTPPPAS